MPEPRLDAPVWDEPPKSNGLTDYDRLHLITYLRLLDAAAAGANPDEVAQIVLRIDAKADPERARRVHAAHLARARWMTENGYRDLLREAKP